MYELAMQVVPLLMIALFLEQRPDKETRSRGWSGWWRRTEARLVALLGLVTFLISIGVVADVIDPNRITLGITVSALSASIVLLFVQIWRRFSRPSADANDEDESVS